MKRRTIGEVIFWGAAALAMTLYGMSMPNGLPWNPSASESRLWCYLVAMAGGSATMLAALAAAGAAGLLGAIVNRYLGWRVGIAAAIVWIYLPGVWNRVLVGERGVVIASAFVVTAWMVNAVVLGVTRKMRAIKSGGALGDRALPGVAHEVHEKYAKVNRIAGWALLGAAGIFAVVSISMHDYMLGEAASVYARLVVEEAGERIILMNGVCDEQIVEELRIKNYELRMKDKSAIPHSSFVILHSSTALSLHDNEANRSTIMAFVKLAFPNATNLWVAAAVSPETFAEAAMKTHPDRFYTMRGHSTTPAKWAARWTAMKPYLRSKDAFIPAMRQMFAYEGNYLGNVLQERGELKAAWELYLRVFKEIHPNNPAACVNLNGMLRRGYKVDGSTRERIESAYADYAKIMKDKREVMRAAQHILRFGPVMRDQKAYEELREQIRQRMEELEKRGEQPKMSIPGLKTLEKWHPEMMKAFRAKDYDKSARIARAILSRKEWRAFIPANVVLGETLMMAGNWTEAEVFLRVAVKGKEDAEPSPMVLNDYAETLRQLKRYDEAEKYARLAVEKTEAKQGWPLRLTLAQILRDAGKEKKVGGENRSTADCSSSDDEIQSLVKDVLKYAPKEAKEMIRKEFPQ